MRGRSVRDDRGARRTDVATGRVERGDVVDELAGDVVDELADFAATCLDCFKLAEEHELFDKLFRIVDRVLAAEQLDERDRAELVELGEQLDNRLRVRSERLRKGVLFFCRAVCALRDRRPSGGL